MCGPQQRDGSATADLASVLMAEVLEPDLRVLQAAAREDAALTLHLRYSPDTLLDNEWYRLWQSTSVLVVVTVMLPVVQWLVLVLVLVRFVAFAREAINAPAAPGSRIASQVVLRGGGGGRSCSTAAARLASSLPLRVLGLELVASVRACAARGRRAGGATVGGHALSGESRGVLCERRSCLASRP